MKHLILLNFSILFMVHGAYAQVSDAQPDDLGVKGSESRTAVTKNARDAVTMARQVFKESYDKANNRFNTCKADHFNKVADCILAGVLYNYSLNYAAVIGHAEDFSRTVHAEEQDSNFDEEANMLSTVMNNINWLKDNGYYFLKDGTIRIPGSTVKTIKLSNFSDPSQLEGVDKLSAAEIAEINSILASINPSAPVTMAEVAPTKTYNVVEESTVAPIADMDKRTLASLNVTFKTDPIAVALADIFDVISIVYETIEPLEPE